MKPASYSSFNSKCILRTLALVFGIGYLLVACQIHPSRSITGFVFENKPLKNAQVRLLDANGKIMNSSTDSSGRYYFPLKSITPPILLSVTTGNESDCITNTRLRPVCMAALITNLSGSDQQIGNINPLTDRIVSDIAAEKGFIGPQQWVSSQTIGEIQSAWVDQALLNLRRGFGDALLQLGVSPEKFDPATYSPSQHSSVSEIFTLIHHNRNYDNNSGETGHSILTDIGFHPIVGLLPNGDYEGFNYPRSKKQLEKIQNAKLRIFIVGDSTSAVYERLRYPRMGWGQALAEMFSNRDDIAVVVGSRAGRSSRDFYNGRWFAQMEPFIKPGDYLLINHGHNDQNCDSLKPIRGTADVNNLCTYPNDAKGQKQYTPEKPDLSFQYSLENYIRIVREKQAYPILLTPTTRIKNAKGEQSLPVVHSHFIKPGLNKNYLYTGDYTQTIKDTARANNVPLVDLESKSIEFVNSLGEAEWKRYWLVVDPQVNSFYANAVPGSTQQPDGTHFQRKGAYKMAELVLMLIKSNPELSSLKDSIE